MSSAYTLKNISDLEDMAGGFGLSDNGEARFARDALGAKSIGMAHYRWNPGKRVSFGHSHKSAEEIYVVLAGGGRMKLDEEIVDIGPKDMLYVDPAVTREWEAGPDGLELIAFGAHAENDGEMKQGWWTD